MADTIAQMTKGEFKEMLETLLNPLIEQKLLEIRVNGAFVCGNHPRFIIRYAVA